MTGRNAPALYEDPSRLSRMVVISCAVVAALLTFLIILPPLLSLLGHSSVTAPHHEIDAAGSTARDGVAASLDDLSRTAKPTSPADDVTAPRDSSTAAIAETSRTAVSSGVETPQRVPPPALAPATDGRSPERPSPWVAAVQSTPDPAPAVDAEAEPVARPPLPRVRPHRVAAAGGAAIPLPPPRPFIPTEAASTDQAAHQRFDPF
jgi:hypothetical protein